MKKQNLFMCIVALFSAFSFVGCEDVTYDVPPQKLEIYVTDHEDTNLLMESSEGNILGEDIYMEFEGEKYSLGDTVAKARAIAPTFYGLTLDDDFGRSEPHLQFGEFNGTESYELEMKLTVAENQYDIKIVRKFEWASDGKPNGRTTLYLDGEEQYGAQMLIEYEK